jgi:hypothetical protein
MKFFVLQRWLEAIIKIIGTLSRLESRGKVSLTVVAGGVFTAVVTMEKA